MLGTHQHLYYTGNVQQVISTFANETCRTLYCLCSWLPCEQRQRSFTWAWALTEGLWVLAGLGIAGKIFLPPISQKVWVPMYLGLAWPGGIAAVPLAGVTSPVVLWLLAVGGMFYSTGVLF